MEKEPRFALQLWNLTLVAGRYLLAAVFISYGVGKLLGSQFGNLTEAEMATPLRELTLFKVAWYLFEDRLFNYFVGISQIVAALLLLFRKTVILGILLFIPILLNILVIDTMIMPKGLKITFIFRLSFYLILCGFILFQEREKLIAIWKVIFRPQAYARYRTWQLFCIPLLVIALEYLHVFLKYAYLFIRHYT